MATRPPVPVVTASHVALAPKAAGFDFDKKSVFLEVGLAGEDAISAALLKALLDTPVAATVTPRHDVTGLTLRVEFVEPAAFDELGPVIEDARRVRLGLPSLAQEAADKARADEAAKKEAEAAVAAAQAKAAEQDQIAQLAADKVLKQLTATPPDAPKS